MKHLIRGIYKKIHILHMYEKFRTFCTNIRIYKIDF